jgi:hypothetical protein
MATSREHTDGPRGETGYSWLYTATAQNGWLRALVTLLIIVLAAAVMAWYTRSGYDAAPDSLLGLTYAGAGTLLLLLAATSYSLRRRSHQRRTLGGLRSALGWHMCFAWMGLALVSMHSFGELNSRSGTYALYGLVALVISGLVGRALDRLVPRLIAGEVHKVLTEQGADRIETISQKLQAIVVYNTQDIRGFSILDKGQDEGKHTLASQTQGRTMTWRDQSLHAPWDLAYISLDATPQELGREAGQFRFIPDKKSEFLRPGALMPGTQEQLRELTEVQQAMRRELFYRYVTRYWRTLHIALALLTLGLLTWHIVYALQLLLPAMQH